MIRPCSIPIRKVGRLALVCNGLTLALSFSMALALATLVEANSRADCLTYDRACKKSYFTTNPCNYTDCRQITAKCVGGSAGAWTKVVNPPSSWPRCSTAQIFDPNIVCVEENVECGTTQFFYDSSCTMYCDPETPGAWYGCQWDSDNCP